MLLYEQKMISKIEIKKLKISSQCKRKAVGLKTHGEEIFGGAVLW